MGFLTVLEVSKKQDYIFKTNRLRENIGASYIIEYTTEKLPETICRKNGGKKISAGGGNSIYYFEGEDERIGFAKEYSTKVLEDFPSLEFFMSSMKYDPEQDRITEKIRSIFNKLEKKKNKREQYAYIYDFGISEKCYSTRLPAVCQDDKGRFISSEIKSKIDFQVSEKFNNQFRYAIDTKELGINQEEKSYIAITHIDGNRMGERVRRIIEKHEEKYNGKNTKDVNENYINEMSKFSQDIKNAFYKAFNVMSNVIINNTKELQEKGMKIKDDVLPCRKIILAGDDVCYITDARIALECANVFIKELEKHEVMGEKITACAGIAMVKDKYPFYRAYELSEQLCSNAKRSIQEGCCESRIDWHIVQGEYNNRIDEIRADAYTTIDSKQLSLRPLVVSDNVKVENHYKLFQEDMKRIFNTQVARSKIKGMLNEMKKGEIELQTYIEINRLYPLFGIHRKNAVSGFQDGKCTIFDAIEAMDYYIPLIEKEG